FMIAQFGNNDWSGNDSLEIFATITNIVVDQTLLPSDTTTIPKISSSSVQPNRNSFQHNSTLENVERNDQITWLHRRRSEDRNIRTKTSEKFGDDSISVDGDGILELQLRVPRSVDSDGTEFRSGISFALNGIIEEMLEKRGKRSALIGNEPPVKITGTEREDDEVSVRFVVDDSAKVVNLSDSLNEIVFSGASASIPYPIVGNIKYLTKRSSNTTLFISASLAVLLLLSMIAFCWKVFQTFGCIERISMYLRRSRVVDLSISDKHNSISVCA
uniref:Uncharacterized protein n=1 Tax=Parascaris univalens TaxID=6257 RepID=A0A915BB86_PARUN